MDTTLERDALSVLRERFNRSRPGHEVVLEAPDALRLLDSYENLIIGVERMSEELRAWRETHPDTVVLLSDNVLGQVSA